MKPTSVATKPKLTPGMRTCTDPACSNFGKIGNDEGHCGGSMLFTGADVFGWILSRLQINVSALSTAHEAGLFTREELESRLNSLRTDLQRVSDAGHLLPSAEDGLPLNQ